MNRAVSAALHTPQLGRDTLLQGAQNSVPSPLSPQRKLRSPNVKYEALEISEVRGPYERKVLSGNGSVQSRRHGRAFGGR